MHLARPRKSVRSVHGDAQVPVGRPNSDDRGQVRDLGTQDTSGSRSLDSETDIEGVVLSAPRRALKVARP